MSHWLKTNQRGSSAAGQRLKLNKVLRFYCKIWLEPFSVAGLLITKVASRIVTTKFDRNYFARIARRFGTSTTMPNTPRSIRWIRTAAHTASPVSVRLMADIWLWCRIQSVAHKCGNGHTFRRHSITIPHTDRHGKLCSTMRMLGANSSNARCLEISFTTD